MKLFLTLILLSFIGCMAKVTVDKRPNLALPIYSPSNTNLVQEYVIVDQGYIVKYSKFGFSTDIESMSAEIATNKTVSFHLGGLHSYATNSITMKLDDLIKLTQMFRDGSTNTCSQLP